MNCRNDISQECPEPASEPFAVSADDVKRMFSNFSVFSNSSSFENYSRFIGCLKECGGHERFSFNIFDVCRIFHHELQVCRLIGSLLDPEGDHGMGSFFLKRFLEMLFVDSPDDDISKEFWEKLCRDENLNHTSVELEFHTPEKRRIDILVNINGFYLPVEVKIFARDLFHQCWDYFSFCLRHNTETGRRIGREDYAAQTRIVYLTLKPGSPQKDSLSSSNGEKPNLRCISFSRDIYEWLSSAAGDLRSMYEAADLRTEFNDCRENGSSDMNCRHRTGRVLSVVEQFLDAVSNITGKLTMDEIEQYLILNSKDNSGLVKSSKDFVAALEFSEKFFPAVKIGMIMKFFEALNDCIGKKLKEKGYDIQKENFLYDPAVIKEAAYEFVIKSKLYPSMEVLLPVHNDYKNYNFRVDYKIALGIEIDPDDGCVWFGYCLDDSDIDIDGGINGIKPKTEGRALREYVKSRIVHLDSRIAHDFVEEFPWWFYAKKFLYNGETVDFSGFNANYVQLYDDDFFRKVISQLADDVVCLYDAWMESAEN